MAEVGYLLQRQQGSRAEAAFMRSLAEGTLTPIDLQGDDFARMVELIETYADFPLGTTDAAVVALAERLDLTEIATLDHRHFGVVRPRHVSVFTLLP